MNRLRCECGQTLGHEPRHAGKKVRCGACARVLVVPGETAAAPEEPRAAPVRDEGPGEALGLHPDDPVEAVEERRPRRRPRKVMREPAAGFLHTVGAPLATGPAVTAMCVMAAVGIGLIVYGYNERRVSVGATEKPQTVSCQQLIAGGIPANPHVLVTDVIPGDNYVYSVRVRKSEQGNTAGKPWDVVYVPLFPLTPALKTQLSRGDRFLPPPAGDRVGLILVSHKAKNVNELSNLFAQANIQGMIVNSISKLDAKSEEMLRQKYTGLDVNKVLILEEGRRPASRAFVLTLLTCGTALIVTAVLMGVTALAFRARE